MSILIETSLGEIVVDLFTEKCYRSSMNFVKLCKLKYFNFHLVSSVEKDFIAQVTNGLNREQESVWGITQGKKSNLFKPEIKFEHRKKGYIGFLTSKAGDLNVAASQFYFTLTDSHLDYLDGHQAIFGEVAEGMEILDQINVAICDDDKRPFRDIRIKHTIVLDDPFDDPPNFVEPDRSPLPTEEMLKTVRLDIDESLEKEDESKRRKAEMDSRALTLEMIGDLPFAEIKPPENVLFVCKLNPVTRDEDLEVIFGRFGSLLRLMYINTVVKSSGIKLLANPFATLLLNTKTRKIQKGHMKRW
jgi:peptidyl-prolyl cis-trans isomerase-like 4